MKYLKSKKWWDAAGTRAIKTMAQTALGMLTIGAAVKDIDWIAVVSVAVVSGVYSLVTSLAGLPEVEDEEDNFL